MGVRVRGRTMLSVETARAAGRRVYTSVRPAWAKLQAKMRAEVCDRLPGLWQQRARLAPAAPGLAVAAVLLLIAHAYFVEQRYDTKLGAEAFAGFADRGPIPGSRRALAALARAHTQRAFAGQFFSFTARAPVQPVICAEQPRPPHCALDQAFGIVRAERVLYPFTAALLTLGQPDWVP